MKYLSLILTHEVPLEARKRELEEKYRIEMTHTMEEEMIGVCNLGEAIARRNREAGRAEGRMEGRAEGRAEGELSAFVTMVRKNLISVKDAAEQLGLPETEFCRKAGLPIQQ